MPKACRVLEDLCTGHDCFPPRQCDEGSPDVFVNGRQLHREGDSWLTHCCPITLECHASVLDKGSPTVFANGKEAGRVGDPVACGSDVATGSPNVFIGPAS